MTPPRTITRKEIASMVGVSVRSVVRHENAWGLRRARLAISGDMGRVLYDRGDVVLAITRRIRGFR